MLERNLGPLCLALGVDNAGLDWSSEAVMVRVKAPLTCQQGTSQSSCGHPVWRNAQEVRATVSGVAGAA